MHLEMAPARGMFCWENLRRERMMRRLLQGGTVDKMELEKTKLKVAFKMVVSRDLLS